MKLLFVPSEEQEAGYLAWAATRPDKVRVVAERFRPWAAYRHKKTGKLVRVLSFSESEDGSVITLSMGVLACLENLSPFEYGVFGVNPDSLEPTDAPDRGDVA